MAGLNRVMLIGHLGNDPDMRFTPNGKAVTNFSLAVTDGKSDTVWFRVVSWEGLAERVNEYLTKGRLVYLEGRLRPREWEGQDGKKHMSLDVVASKVVFLGAKSPQEKAGEAAPVGEEAAGEEDIPF